MSCKLGHGAAYGIFISGKVHHRRRRLRREVASEGPGEKEPSRRVEVEVCDRRDRRGLRAVPGGGHGHGRIVPVPLASENVTDSELVPSRRHARWVVSSTCRCRCPDVCFACFFRGWLLFGKKQRRALSLSAAVVSPCLMSATARPSVSNRPSIVDGLAYVLPDVFIAEILPKLNLISTLNLAQVSKWYRDAVSAALPRTFDFEGVAGDLAGHLVRLLDDPRVRSLGKERALELIGVHKDRLCEYACVQRNFEVLKWARNELNLPLEPYPAEPVSDDVLVLRMLRTMCPELQKRWPVDTEPEEWVGVTMDRGRVVTLVLQGFGLTGAAEIGRLSALRQLILYDTQLTSVPAEIGQLTSLKWLDLGSNQLTSLPAEVGHLTALKRLNLRVNKLRSVPSAIRELRAAGCSMVLDDGVRVGK